METANGVTNVNAIGIAITVTLIVTMLFLDRKYAIIPVLLAACVITQEQVINIAGLVNFTMLRFVILFAWIRLAVRRELHVLYFNSIDKAVTLWVFINLAAALIAFRSTGDIINKLGFVYDTIGIYFLFRFLIKDYADIRFILKFFVIIAIPIAVIMIVESVTGHNIFAFFGSVPFVSEVRDGKLRCQGPFRSPILAGTFGSTLMPLFASLWFDLQTNRIYCLLGIAAASVITVVACTSGALLAYLFGIVALCMWFLRKRMRIIRWSVLFSIVLLHFLMTAPVWYLIARISNVTGGTGWHRSYLIDQTIAHFGDWWLLGTRDTADWMPYTLEAYPDKADITNQYIMQGVDGGLLTMIVFISIIVLCFSYIGRTMLIMNYEKKNVTLLGWALGATMFSHVVSFVSVVYFDQTIIFWLLLIVLIVTYTMKTFSTYVTQRQAKT